MKSKVSLLGLIVFASLNGLCRDTININNPSPTPTPTVTVNPIPLNTIEYRVTGNAANVKINYSFPTDGLTLVTTVLPYDISLSTPSNTIFVSLSATPITYTSGILVPYLSVQIFANGNLFREATSSDFSFNAVSVSGTWRK